MTELSVVIPTLGGRLTLRRVLDLLERQSSIGDRFEAIVVRDAVTEDPDGVRAAVGERPYGVRLLDASVRGASAARNRGWLAASAPVILFLGDDILPGPTLVSEHLGWHRRHPEPEVGVLGRVDWARELRVTPFMRWLERGIQFDYRSIRGTEAGWGRFYTANVSVKRKMLRRVGGFDDQLPFLYEDLDLGRRMHDVGFRLLYNPAARAEHLHPTTPEDWSRRAELIARSERRFVRKHPDVDPYFLKLFRAAMDAPAPRGRAARLARVVPERLPWLGPRVWRSADAVFRRRLAPPFLAAWDAAERDEAQSEAAGGLERTSSGGSEPSGP